MKNRTLIIFTSLGAVAAIVVGILFFTRSANQDKNSEFEKSRSALPAASGSASESVSGDLTYTHPVLKFSLQYPKDFQVVTFNEEEGAETVLIQNPATKKGFQIFTSPYDEGGPITSAQIKKDLPNIVIEDPQNVILGSQSSDKLLKSDFRSLGGIPALIFFSRDESLGRTREVWFVWPEDPKLAGNYLYQVTAKADFDAELSQIMATFVFNE